MNFDYCDSLMSTTAVCSPSTAVEGNTTPETPAGRRVVELLKDKAMEALKMTVIEVENLEKVKHFSLLIAVKNFFVRNLKL